MYPVGPENSTQPTVSTTNLRMSVNRVSQYPWVILGTSASKTMATTMSTPPRILLGVNAAAKPDLFLIA